MHVGVDDSPTDTTGLRSPDLSRSPVPSHDFAAKHARMPSLSLPRKIPLTYAQWHRIGRTGAMRESQERSEKTNMYKYVFDNKSLINF